MRSLLSALVLVAVGMALMAVLAGDGITQAQSPRYINLPGRSDDLPYCNAVLVGDTLYLAGSIGIDPETGAPPDKIEDEVRIVMDSMKQRLEMVGMTMDDLVTVRVFCSGFVPIRRIQLGIPYLFQRALPGPRVHRFGTSAARRPL